MSTAGKKIMDRLSKEIYCQGCFALQNKVAEPVILEDEIEADETICSNCDCSTDELISWDDLHKCYRDQEKKQKSLLKQLVDRM